MNDGTCGVLLFYSALCSHVVLFEMHLTVLLIWCPSSLLQVSADDWCLLLETFDPHEPFFSQPEFQALYPHEYTGPPFDWPPYREVREDQASVEHIRCVYAALLTFCDAQLGRVLDMFDKHDLWQNTMLIVNT